MTAVSINGIPQKPARAASSSHQISTDRLRMIVQDSHINFLIGAGTPSSFFGLLGNVEDALTQLAESPAEDNTKAIVRASIQAYFFDKVLAPNLKVIRREPAAQEVLTSYAEFLRTMNRILIKRHSPILAKQANIFTTNVDMVFEVALEQMGMDFSDGFSGKIRPRFNLGDFNIIRLRMASRFEQRSEVPALNLVKIHGSAGWLQEYVSYAERDEIVFDHGLTLVRAVSEKLESARESLIKIEDPDEITAERLISKACERDPLDQIPAAVAAFTDAYDRLGIVNPDKRKFATTVLNQTYYELIRRFANELEKENSVLFVHGFSFRDEHLRDLVVRAARFNPTLQVIVFCYSRHDLSHYQRMILDKDIKNSNILFVLPPEPKGGAEEVKATIDVVTRDYFVPIIEDKFSSPGQRIELDIRLPSEGGNGV